MNFEKSKQLEIGIGYVLSNTSVKRRGIVYLNENGYAYAYDNEDLILLNQQFFLNTIIFVECDELQHTFVPNLNLKNYVITFNRDNQCIRRDKIRFNSIENAVNYAIDMIHEINDPSVTFNVSAGLYSIGF